MRGGPAQVRLGGRGGPDGYVWVLFRVHGSRLRLLFQLLTRRFRAGSQAGSPLFCNRTRVCDDVQGMKIVYRDNRDFRHEPPPVPEDPRESGDGEPAQPDQGGQTVPFVGTFASIR